jgi:D-inositol-3-phosphate glycosyltransferase
MALRKIPGLGRRERSALIEPAAPKVSLEGSVDRPVRGDVVPRGMLTVAGWHMIGDRPALAVSVVTNGIPAGVGIVGSIERPDVATALGNEDAARSGWSVEVDLTQVVDDEVDLEVTVWESTGTLPTTLPPITVVKESIEERSVTGRLDTPADGDVVPGDILKVRGWCLFEGTHVARVEVVVDGMSMGLARPFLDRPDVASRYDHADAPVAGFEALISSERLDRPVESLVTVEVTSLDGQRWRSETRRVRWAVPRAVDADQAEHFAHRRKALLEGVPGGGSRVLVFTHDLSYGGGQLWLLELLRQVRVCSGLEITVVSPGDGPLRDALEELGIAVHVTAPWRVDDVNVYEDRVNELALLLRSSGAGVVLVNTLGVFPGIDAAERAGVPALWAIHESFDLASYCSICWGPTVIDPQVLARFKACFRSARALIFEARQTAELFEPLCSPGRCFVLDYGVDVDEIDSYRKSVDQAVLRADMGLAEDDVVVAVVGVVEPRKGQAAAVAAFDVLAGVHDRLRLVLVGSQPTSYDAGMRERIERSTAADRIELLPIVPDIYPSYAVADVLLCASDVESLPRSILEAMAFELPVVSTDVFGITDLIEDGRTGWLTRPRDLESLVGLLHLVLRLPADERRAVGVQAREEVLRRHGDHSYGRVFARLLSALLDDPSCDLTRVFVRVS